jgi:malate dehydrogenase (oxaloacetate-decarboxylating)(NADP+)
LLVFPSLASGNAAYQMMKVFGTATPVGPILLGVNKPVAAMQNDATVEEIVNMTAYVVLRAQQQQRKLEQKRA